MRQLAIPFDPPTHPSESDELEWASGWVPDRTGPASYVLMIRSRRDPKRRPRPRGGQLDRSPHLTLARTSPADWEPRLAALLRDQGPMTFNAASVLLLDKTADITSPGPLEDALWNLVRARRVAFTLDAPILFAYLDLTPPSRTSSAPDSQSATVAPSLPSL